MAGGLYVLSGGTTIRARKPDVLQKCCWACSGTAGEHDSAWQGAQLFRQQRRCLCLAKGAECIGWMLQQAC